MSFHSLVCHHLDPDDSNLLLVGWLPIGSALPDICIHPASHLNANWPRTPQGTSWYDFTAPMRCGVGANYSVANDALYRKSSRSDQGITQPDVDGGDDTHEGPSWDCWEGIP